MWCLFVGVFSLASANSDGSCLITEGTDTGGTILDTKRMLLGDEHKCCEQCQKTEGCVGFTWVTSKHMCRLKSHLGEPFEDLYAVSGSFHPSPYPDGCGVDVYVDPKYEDMEPINWAEVNLDLPPSERWAVLAKQFSPQIQDLVDSVKSMASVVSEGLFALLEDLEKANADELLTAMPAPYGDEIRGIAAAAGLSKLDALICNLIYEITGACTAVIAQDSLGHVYHAHNLDTAAIWNFTTGQWKLADKLRAITTNVRFTKSGKVLFNATTYAGYAGVFEGMKAGFFSASVNTRFDTALYASLRHWISGKDRSGQFGTFNVRDALEQDTSFADAVDRLNSTKIMGPGYFAVAGVEAGEGAIMSRGANASYGFWSLADELERGKPYMVQTNYDHWKADPFFDRRRVPAEKCMDGLTEGELSFERLFPVVSAKPTRNKMTCHSVLFSAREGKIESYQQYCLEPGCKMVMNTIV